MARITVEDCTEGVSSRFALVALAAQRAKDISRGSPIMVDRDNDKNAVVALREFAAKKVNIARLYESLVASLQTRNKVDIIEDENLHAEVREAAHEEGYENTDFTFEDYNMDLDESAFSDNIEDDK